MNFIDKIALRLAKYIRENNPEGPSQEVLFFALVLVLGSFISIGVTLIISIFTGHTEAFLTIFIIFMLMRLGSGGVHFQSSLICCIVTIIVLSGLPFIHISYWYSGFIITCLSLMIVIKYTPDELRKHHWISPSMFPYLFAFTIIVVLSNFFIQNSFVSLGIAAQTFTMPPRVQKIILSLERRKHP